MSVSRPAQCLFCRTRMLARVLPAHARRHYSDSASGQPPSDPSGNEARHRKALEKATRGLRKYKRAQKLIEKAAKALPRFTPEELAELAAKYSPEQMKAIEAGEESIDPADLAVQGTLRRDGHRPWYIDDFSMVDPLADKPIRNPESNYDPRLRPKTDDDLVDDLVRFYQELPEDLSEDEAQLAYRKFEDQRRKMVGKEEAETAVTSYLAQELPKIEDPDVRYASADNETETDPLMARVYRQTGFTREDVSKFRIKALVHRRVTNVTRMGKIQSDYYLTVAGNGLGMVGIGEGKGIDMEAAKTQSRRAAIRNMQPIVRYERRTIFGEVQAKVGAAVVNLYSRPPGFGVRCQQYIFEICRCAGITDLAARVTRSRNPMNVIKATIEALKSQRNPEELARGRGKKFVDVRKVYYGGQHASS